MKANVMNTIRATVRDGRIEVDGPLNLPDGTELMIPLPDVRDTLGIRDDEWEDTPAAREAWIRWYDGLELVEFTAGERAAWQ